MAQQREPDEATKYLYEAILTLGDTDECRRFFEDLCTIAEIGEMSRRLLAAKMLSENHVYAAIAEQTGLSTATISRVNRCLKYGDGGYNTALERMALRKKR